ncbi:MAG: hypothetical protein V3T17_11400 [Pseudomonadales bacterium]
MVGFKYVVVEAEIAAYLWGLELERVSYKPATIWDRNSGTEHANYEQIIVNHHFESGQINDTDIDGKQLLLMENRYLFASPELKVDLEKSVFNFKFSAGLENFA